MVLLAAGPPEAMTSADVTSPPLADVAFIDADGDAAATDSDASERTEAAESPGSPDARPPAALDAGDTEAVMSAPTAVTAPAAPRPLKSALKRGSSRRRLQVVINESRNTYCEAEPLSAEEAPLLVRAFSLRLPELLSCQAPAAFADAVTLSPPDAYRDIVAAGELCQETVVDDSEGSECSADGLETPAGPAPLAQLDDDIALEPSDDSSTPEQTESAPEPADTGSGTPDRELDRTTDIAVQLKAGGAEEPTELILMEPTGDVGPTKDVVVELIGDVAPDIKEIVEIAGGTFQETSEDIIVRALEEVVLERADELVSNTAEDAARKRSESITAEPADASELVEESAQKPTESTLREQTEDAQSDSRSGTPPADSPPPAPAGPPSPPDRPTAERAPRAAWRNLPDLVSDGARAAAGSGSGSDPPSPSAAAPSAGPSSAAGAGSGSVLTIANVQQHDKVMEIADSRAGVLLSGILKGGRLWAGGRGGGGGGDSDDSGDSQPRRSVRFERPAPPAPAPRLLQPPPAPAAESDGESSLSSMDTVIARGGAQDARGAAQPAQLDALRCATDAARGEAASDGSESSGGSAASDSTLDALRLRQRAVAELALAAGLGRSSADVARAIEHNSLRRSLARANEMRLNHATGGQPAAARNPTQQSPSKPAPGAAAAKLAASGCGVVPPSHAETKREASSRDASSPPREAPPGRPAGAAFSSPPDIQVPGDVREWKMSETLWPSPSPRPRVSAAVETAAPPAGGPPSPQRPIERLNTLLSAAPAGTAAVSPEPRERVVTPDRRPPPEPRRLQFLSPAGRKAADSRIHQAAQQLFNQSSPQSAQQPSQQGSQQHSQQGNQQSAQRLPSREVVRQPSERQTQQRPQWPAQQPAEAPSQQPPQWPAQQPAEPPSQQPAQWPAQQLAQNMAQQQPVRYAKQPSEQLDRQQPSQLAARELFPATVRPVATQPPGWESRLPPRPAGARDSAASSADSRDSYSLDDIDDALAEPAPAASPPAAKAGSADSGYGSTDGHAAAEPDELAAFAEREAARTERLRQRYAGGNEEEAGFARRASVRGIKPRFECTSEILRQMQSRAAPEWARPRGGRDARRLPALRETRPAAALGSTDALYAPEPRDPRDPRDPRRLRYASAQHLPQSREAAGGNGGGRGGRLAPDEEWRWPGPPAPLPHGYVYPEYQPPRGPPLPPRHGQVRPTGLPPQAAHLPVYQSTPNLYMPPQQPSSQQQQHLLMQSASTLPLRQPRQLDLYQQQQQQAAGWGGAPRPSDQQVTQQFQAAGRQQAAAGAPVLRHRPGPADGEWVSGQDHVRPFSSSDIYPQLRGSYGAGFAPQGYMRDVQMYHRDS